MRQVEYEAPRERPKTFKRIRPDPAFCFTNPDFLNPQQIIEQESSRDPLENSITSRAASELLKKCESRRESASDGGPILSQKKQNENENEE